MFSLSLRLVLLSLFILLLDSRGYLGPAKAVVLSLSLPFEEGFNLLGRSGRAEAKFWTQLFSLRGENKNLKETLSNLESKILKLSEVDRENELLRQQLKVITNPTEKGLILGKVVGRLSGRPTVVLIDQGQDSQVKVGDLVIYKNFVYGRVLLTSAKVAKIRLITDPEISFDGTDIDSRNAKGEVRGNFGTALKMDKILPTEKINTGDTIVESTTGYILGKVERVEKEGANILKTADLKVPYEIEKVEKVFIIPE